jgi:PHD/YefM family antitoxin component YafN of YafNO toxin-antitoxin module
VKTALLEACSKNEEQKEQLTVYEEENKQLVHKVSLYEGSSEEIQKLSSKEQCEKLDVLLHQTAAKVKFRKVSS